MANNNHQVAEMPGLYGPYTLSERVVQKIWLRGDFAHDDLRLTDGRRLVIQSAGKWNLLAGPDFLRARLSIDGQPVVGDVEVHFHERDWRSHGHAADGAYGAVVLHVVLFPMVSAVDAARHMDGRAIPTLVLLPYLHRGLEEYGADDALEILTERDGWRHYAELAGQVPEDLRERLQSLAADRWRQKVHFATQRLQRLGWEDALHHTALEILGYRQNRAPMLATAQRYPLPAWHRVLDPQAILRDSGLRWQRQGVRPANDPLLRLRQYAQWVCAYPDWPARLAEIADQWRPGGPDLVMMPTGRVRRLLGLRARRLRLLSDVMGGAITGPRADNLVADGFLPLLAARRPEAEIWPLWFHWPLGDVPAEVWQTLNKLEVVDRKGHSHCQGWAQGMLGWFLVRSADASP